MKNLVSKYQATQQFWLFRLLNIDGESIKSTLDAENKFWIKLSIKAIPELRFQTLTSLWIFNLVYSLDWESLLWWKLILRYPRSSLKAPKVSFNQDQTLLSLVINPNKNPLRSMINYGTPQRISAYL